MAINLRCSIKFKNIQGLTLSINGENVKIMKFDEEKQLATIRDKKGERIEILLSIDLLNNKDNLAFSSCIKYIKSITLKDNKIDGKKHNE